MKTKLLNILTFSGKDFVEIVFAIGNFGGELIISNKF